MRPKLKHAVLVKILLSVENKIAHKIVHEDNSGSEYSSVHRGQSTVHYE